MLKRLALALVSGLVLSLAFEPVALPWLMPFAVAGFALSVRGLRLRSGWLPGLVFGVAFYYPHIWWMRSVGTDAWLALAGVEALFYAVLGALAAVLQRRRLWPLWFAAAWVAVEAWRSGWPFSGMPWGRLAFGVADTPAAALLPWVGAVGTSFAVALAGALLAALALAWRGRARADLRRWGIGLGALACLGALAVLVPAAPASEGSVRVAAVQGDVPGPGNNILYDPDGVTRNHVEATVDLAEDVEAGEVARPDLVLWPENSTAADPFRRRDLGSGIERAAEAIGVPILVGAIVDAGEEHVLNQGIVWDPETGAGERYTKWHPVPYGEYIPFRDFFTGQFGRLAAIPRDMLSGTRTDPLTVAGVDLADAICFDVAYDDGIHAQVRNGAELLVVQTSNATFMGTDQLEQQFEITRVRAMETGRWTVVASTNGVSGVISPDGEVVARARTRSQEVLLAEVGLSSSVTPGVRLAPWIVRASAIATVLGVLLSVVPYRRRHRPAPSAEEDPTPVPTSTAGVAP